MLHDASCPGLVAQFKEATCRFCRLAQLAAVTGATETYAASGHSPRPATRRQRPFFFPQSKPVKTMSNQEVQKEVPAREVRRGFRAEPDDGPWPFTQGLHSRGGLLVPLHETSATLLLPATEKSRLRLGGGHERRAREFGKVERTNSGSVRPVRFTGYRLRFQSPSDLLIVFLQ